MLHLTFRIKALMCECVCAGGGGWRRATNTVTLRALVKIQDNRGKERGENQPSTPGKGARLGAGLRTTKGHTPEPMGHKPA